MSRNRDRCRDCTYFSYRDHVPQADQRPFGQHLDGWCSKIFPRGYVGAGKPGNVTCHCEIDGHYISYVACFEKWCRRWARETKWDKTGGQDE